MGTDYHQGSKSTEANQENFDKFKERLKNLYANGQTVCPDIIDNFKSDPGPSSKPQLDGQAAQEEERYDTTMSYESQEADVI